MTVSSPELDNLVKAAREAGALGAKLSGAGRGGNMIALVAEGGGTAVTQALYTAGASQVIETVIEAKE
jgi:mevalonate kinase